MSRSNGKSLFVLGSSHRTASIETRERLALNPERARQLADDLRRTHRVEECMILNTCNRVEIYGVASVPELKMPLLNQLSAVHGIPALELEQLSYFMTGEEAVFHAFEVAAGIDSQMVGENEILGQLKDAYAKASGEQLTGRVLNQLFQKSFQAAKWVRTNTGISKGHISIGNIACELATRVCGDLTDAQVILLGSGEVGEKTTQALASRGAERITVTARNLKRAHALAEQFTAAVAPLERLPRLLAQADILIGATSSTSPLVTRQLLQPIMEQRMTRPLIAIDTALPRDFDPVVENLENVYLYNLDHLAEIANENLKAREREVVTAKENLLARAKRLWNSMT